MADEEKKEESSAALVPVDMVSLKVEAQRLLNQLITESDAEKQDQITRLFIENQNKKTMARMTKMDDLLDIIVDQATDRFQNHTDEIPTKELIDAMKAVTNMLSQGRTQITEEKQTQGPVIQINNQENTVNVGDSKKALNRESREKVKNLMRDVLGDLMAVQTAQLEDTVIDVTSKEENEDD